MRLLPSPRRGLWRSAVVVALLVSVTSCIIAPRTVYWNHIEPADGTEVRTPVKAHLRDGSTVVYEAGVRVYRGHLFGDGVKWDPELRQSTAVSDVAVDDVVGMESFTTRTKVGEAIVYSSLATAGVVVGTVLLAVAIFGSCPTVYSSDGAVEEAELFSSSIAPLFEGRDLDRLRATADARGQVRLQIRNEALETHYTNHLQLVEVDHAPDAFVLPDADGRPLAVGPIHAPASAVDRRGRSVLDAVAAVDEKAFASDPRALDRVTATDLDDWIDVTAPVSPEAESTAVVLRLRNSLLSTELLYDTMLAPAGAGAVDWMGSGLAEISTAVQLGRWHERRSGLHVSIWENGAYRDVGRVPDCGPIAWHDVAIVVPVRHGRTSVRLRLSFLTDYWRIDRLGIAEPSADSSLRVVPLTDVLESNGRSNADALANLRAPDQRYLQTTPGQQYTAVFDVGAAPAGRSRTFLLSSQGYYTEWIRGSWVQHATRTTPALPDDASLVATLKRWAETRDDFERRFFSSKVAVH